RSTTFILRIWRKRYVPFAFGRIHAHEPSHYTDASIYRIHVLVSAIGISSYPCILDRKQTATQVPGLPFELPDGATFKAIKTTVTYEFPTSTDPTPLGTLTIDAGTLHGSCKLREISQVDGRKKEVSPGYLLYNGDVNSLGGQLNVVSVGTRATDAIYFIRYCPDMVSTNRKCAIAYFESDPVSDPPSPAPENPQPWLPRRGTANPFEFTINVPTTKSLPANTGYAWDGSIALARLVINAGSLSGVGTLKDPQGSSLQPDMRTGRLFYDNLANLTSSQLRVWSSGWRASNAFVFLDQNNLIMAYFESDPNQGSASTIQPSDAPTTPPLPLPCDDKLCGGTWLPIRLGSDFKFSLEQQSTTSEVGSSG
ncbi:hypothetical protein FRB99_008499, partial [Tulasnella sp. 403]